MDADKIVRAYMKAHKSMRGIKSYTDAQMYAENVGKDAAAALNDYDFTNVSESELSMVLRLLLRQAHFDASAAAKLAQRIQNERAGLGIGVLEAAFDPSEADKIATELVGKAVTKEFVQNLIGQKTVGTVDETLRKNAEAREEIGLHVRIERKYSDVGLRDGTPYAEPCQWCLDRCGTWDSYKEAYDAGCFERHPGCLCTIDYEVGKTHTKTRGWGGWVDV